MARSVNAPAVGEVHVVDDVAQAFTAQVRSVAGTPLSGRPCSLVLSGGATARLCYEHLAGAGAVDWHGTEILMGDERCVAPDDPDANQRLVREALLFRLVEAPPFHPMACDDESLSAYQQLIEARPVLDLVHLGLGPDGHTASLFPRSPALDAAPGTLVTRNEDPSGSNPHGRVTLTFEAIARARLVVFTVSGASKREAWAALCAGADVPAARVRAQSVLWLVDREAAGPA
ncbi:MAG: 6-phosphogluconolactonase [Acidimicrobiales bacterium]